MNAAHALLIDVTTLERHLRDPKWIVFDCRHELTDPDAGRKAYATGHLPGAIFLAVDEDLSAPRTRETGRHPLPTRERFRDRLAALGVSDAHQVVAYDAHGGVYAGRLWWMLRWLGHANCALLDGGLPAWTANGGALEQTLPPPRPAAALTLRSPLVAEVDAKAIEANLAAQRLAVVDARAPDRYRGENETIDPVAGHIPGARNRFFRDNLQADGRFKSPETLRAEFNAFLAGHAPEAVVHQCGSGITACHNLLAMEIAGLTGSALYPGSWSEWIVDPTRPVERGG